MGGRLPPEALGVLSLDRAPYHAMHHPFCKALDVAAAEAVPGEWVCSGGTAGHVALDGKRLCGSAAAGYDGNAGAHLVSAFASRLSAVIGPMQVTPEGRGLGSKRYCWRSRPSCPVANPSAGARGLQAR